MTTFEGSPGSVPGPSDSEVVRLLQRMASAHAQLLQAEQAMAEPDRSESRRNDAIEEAHADVLWAQARLLSSTRSAKVTAALEAATHMEKAVLKRYGYGSFREYLTERTSPPTEDVHLTLARREYAEAQAAWEQLQGAMDGAGGAPAGSPAPGSGGSRPGPPPAPTIPAPPVAPPVDPPSGPVAYRAADPTVVVDLPGGHPRRIE